MCSRRREQGILFKQYSDVHEGKLVLDPAITQKLMSNLFQKPEKSVVQDRLTDRELEVLRLAAKGFTETKQSACS